MRKGRERMSGDERGQKEDREMIESGQREERERTREDRERTREDRERFERE